jgi:hypothetical protein
MVERIAAVATWWPQTMSLLALAVLVAAFTFSRAAEFSGTRCSLRNCAGRNTHVVQPIKCRRLIFVRPRRLACPRKLLRVPEKQV